MKRPDEIKDGILCTEVGAVYFSPYEQHLVEALLAVRSTGRLLPLSYLVESLYQYPRDEPEWPEEVVKMLLSRIRKKLPKVGLLLTSSRGHGRGYRIEAVLQE